MSHSGKKPINIPKNVVVTLDKRVVAVKGPKGELSLNLIDGVNVDQKDSQLFVEVNTDIPKVAKFHGLSRSLIENLIIGTSTGFEKTLEMIGVGYKAAMKGNLLDLQVGFSHPTQLEVPAGLSVKIEKNTIITIQGIDKQLVGQFAATVRALRPPEPYKGKGIRYKNEYVRRKAGKTSKK